MGNPRKVIAMVEVTDDVDLMGTEGREEQKGIENQQERKRRGGGFKEQGPASVTRGYVEEYKCWL